MKYLKLYNESLEEGPKKVLVHRRSKEERAENLKKAIYRKIREYIKNGSWGGLDLNGTPIESLPDNLSVRGSLHLEGSQIKSLPDNLSVRGNLDLSNTPIKSLPDNLSVEWDLYLGYTQIESLPDNLSVGGDLDLSNTPLSKKYTEKEIRSMCDVKGEIHM